MPFQIVGVHSITLTQEDFDALPRNEEGVNQLGTIFAMDGNAVRLPSKDDVFAEGNIGNTVGFPVRALLMHYNKVMYMPIGS